MGGIFEGLQQADDELEAWAGLIKTTLVMAVRIVGTQFEPDGVLLDRGPPEGALGEGRADEMAFERLVAFEPLFPFLGLFLGLFGQELGLEQR